ncbi:MAG TPA: hypothetical protein GXX14_04620 [Clostridiaceae bacterium]|nr:hypothetical protein [Clostridiaceae bacterium]
MLIVLAVFAVLIISDFLRFIRNKEPAKVFVIYTCLMATSLSISLLLAAGRRPSSPAQWIEAVFKMIGVLE